MAETKANSLAFLLQRFRNAQDRRPIIYKQFDGFAIELFVGVCRFAFLLFSLPHALVFRNQKADDHFSAFKSLISDDDDEHHHHHHGHSQRLPKKIAAFQQQTAAITQEFQAVSLEIRAVEAELNELGQTTIAALIRELQLLEKSNLMTVR
jgi:hypothetical protein